MYKRRYRIINFIITPPPLTLPQLIYKSMRHPVGILNIPTVSFTKQTGSFRGVHFTPK